MYAEYGGQHHTPHFHAYYQDDTAVFSIDPIELIAGNLPRRQRRYVEASAEFIQRALLEYWNLLHQASSPRRFALDQRP